MKLNRQVVLAGLLVVLLSSCVQLPRKRTMDKSLTPEQSAVVTFGPEIYVSTVNGIEVKEAWYNGGYTSLQIIATIPAGETIVGFDIYFMRKRDFLSDIVTISTIKNIQMKYHFEAGKKYDVRFSASDGTKTLATLAIYEAPWAQGKIPLKSWEFEFE
jgi:hypothetical protein